VSRRYPAHRESDVVLRDGSTVSLRPARPEDEAALARFFSSLSIESQAFRFFSGAADLEETAHELAAVDYEGRYGLLATRGGPDGVVGHGVYVEIGEGSAEVAFAIAGEMQARGLGTIMLGHLAQAAAGVGIETFVAEILPQNHKMIEVFRDSGFPVETSATPDGIRVELPTSFSEKAVAHFAERDRVAARAAVASFLAPRSVAIIGASRRPESIGGAVLRNVIESGYEGPVHPVNPSAKQVQKLAAHPTVGAIPGEVELAVIAIPAEGVVEAARECAAKGVRGLLVLSAGFGESGAEGAARERELREVCREAGMRLVGPNCLGVLNTARGTGLNVTFAPEPPPPGPVGFVSQSGALGLALIEFAAERGLGVSSFASVGNRADITANDLLEYWEDDGETRVALLYIESFSDPRRFSRVAQRIGTRMPIVVVKSGRSAAGARATGSHTGALVASSDAATDAIFEQAGVIRTETMAELLDVTSLLAGQPLPEGSRVGILTNAGGPGIMCADACEAAGLEVPQLPEEVRARLGELLPPEASLANPVDMIATATAEQYRQAIGALGEWEGIDALIVIFIRPLRIEAGDVSWAIRAGRQELERQIPIQAVFMSPTERSALAERAGLPTYLHPEDAAKALAKAVRHQRWRHRPPAEVRELPDARADEASAVIAEALEAGRDWLDAAACQRLLDCYGIPLPESRIAADPDAVAAAASALGGRVALKAQGSQIVHKTELGAVRLGIEGAQAAWDAATGIDAELGAAGVERESFLVQRMVGGGTELLVGVATDPVFGPVLACGAGGTAAELTKDVAVRICPLSGADCAELPRSLAIFPLLEGYRGAPPADLAAIEDLLARVSTLADTHHEIAELDLNPLMAGPDGVLALDARVRVSLAPPPRPWPRTWA